MQNHEEETHMLRLDRVSMIALMLALAACSGGGGGNDDDSGPGGTPVTEDDGDVDGGDSGDDVDDGDVDGDDGGDDVDDGVDGDESGDDVDDGDTGEDGDEDEGEDVVDGDEGTDGDDDSPTDGDEDEGGDDEGGDDEAEPPVGEDVDDGGDVAVDDDFDLVYDLSLTDLGLSDRGESSVRGNISDEIVVSTSGGGSVTLSNPFITERKLVRMTVDTGDRATDRILISQIGTESFDQILNYSSFAIWSIPSFGDTIRSIGSGHFVNRDVATSIPVSGSAGYSGSAMAVEGVLGDFSGETFFGSFGATANFSANTLTGRADLEEFGSVNFGTATISRDGRPTFVGGGATASGGYELGGVEGQFAGPEGEEIVGRFSLIQPGVKALTGSFGGRRE